MQTCSPMQQFPSHWTCVCVCVCSLLPDHKPNDSACSLNWNQFTILQTDVIVVKGLTKSSMTPRSKRTPSFCLVHILLPQTKKNHLELTTNLDRGSQHYDITTTLLNMSKYHLIRDIRHNKLSSSMLTMRGSLKQFFQLHV